MSRAQVSPYALLTGAGFSADFGGFLVEKFDWRVRNSLSPTLRTQIDSWQGNFEDWYGRAFEGVASGEFDRESFESLEAAVRRTFEEMDVAVKHCISESAFAGLPIPGCLFSSFVSWLGGEIGQYTYLFTLNQDLLVERAWNEGQRRTSLVSWGAKGWKSGSGSIGKLTLSTASPPDPESQSPGSRAMIYLKLHGSMNWGSSRGGDCLVIGTTKDKLIEREPFLKWCLNRFRAVLSRSKWLIVAGYGFGDKHVNDEIVNAIRDHDLSVSVILPGSLASLLDKIRDAPVTGAKRLGERVSTGAFEFCPMRVRELYHEQSGPTIELKSWFKKWGVPGSWS